MIDTTNLAPQAHAYFHQQDDQKATDEFSSVIAQQETVTGNGENVFALKNDLAVAHLFAGNFDNAISLLKECEAFYIGKNDRGQLATVYANLASVYEKKKQVSQAISHYLRSLDNITDTNESQQQKYFIHYELSKLYLRKLNFVKVYAHYAGALSYKTKQTFLDKFFLWITSPR